MRTKMNPSLQDESTTQDWRKTMVSVGGMPSLQLLTCSISALYKIYEMSSGGAGEIEVAGMGTPGDARTRTRVVAAASPDAEYVEPVTCRHDRHGSDSEVV